MLLCAMEALNAVFLLPLSFKKLVGFKLFCQARKKFCECLGQACTLYVTVDIQIFLCIIKCINILGSY